MGRWTLAAAVILLPAAAFADPAAADKCAQSLPKDARAIYDKVAANRGAGDLAAQVKAQTRALAMAGQIDRSSARANAQAAGKCLTKG